MLELLALNALAIFHDILLGKRLAKNFISRCERRFLVLLRKIYFILGPFNSRIPILLFFFVLISLFDVLGIGLIGPFVSVLSGSPLIDLNDILNKLNLNYNLSRDAELLFFGFCLIAIFSIKCFFGIFLQRKILKFGYEIRLKTVNDLVRRYYSLDHGALMQRDFSKVILNSTTHIGLFVDSVFIPLMRLLIEVIVAIGICVLLTITNPYLACVLFFIFGCLTIVYFQIIRTTLYSCGQIMSEREASLIQSLRHLFGAFVEVKLLRAEGFFKDRINADITSYAKAGVTSRALHLTARYLIEVVMVSCIVCAVFVMLFFNYSSDEVFATLSVFAVGCMRMVPSANQVSLGLANIKSGSYAMDSLVEELSGFDHNVQPGPQGTVDVKKSPFHFESIMFSDVTFDYPSAKNALFKSMNLELNRGDIVGIVGPSGVGKSTFLNLFLGLLNPTGGKVLINGNSEFNLMDAEIRQSWQRDCAYIPQVNFLLNATVAENVALGQTLEELDEELVCTALANAGLDVQKSNSSFGIFDDIQEGAHNVSGGQAQRIALARAFYAKRKVLVLDEATSALDEATEASVLKFLAQSSGELTIVLVTHNPRVLSICNRVIRFPLTGNLSGEDNVRQ